MGGGGGGGDGVGGGVIFFFIKTHGVGQWSFSLCVRLRDDFFVLNSCAA